MLLWRILELSWACRKVLSTDDVFMEFIISGVDLVTGARKWLGFKQVRMSFKYMPCHLFPGHQSLINTNIGLVLNYFFTIFNWKIQFRDDAVLKIYFIKINQNKKGCAWQARWSSRAVVLWIFSPWLVYFPCYVQKYCYLFHGSIHFHIFNFIYHLKWDINNITWGRTYFNL